MLEHDVPLPHFKVYIKDNWTLYKTQTAGKLKPLLSNPCQPFTDEEDSKFAKWFEDQKTIEKRRTKKQQSGCFPKSNSSTALQGQNLSETPSTQYKMMDNTLEEKKQDQNLELFLNDECQLLSSLLQWTTHEDKFIFLKSQLQSNFLVLTKFMRTRREAPQGFLELVLRLCKELEETQQQYKQTLLFIRVCALHQKEPLEATKELIRNAFMELANDTTDEQAAYGLLKLAYINDISFKSFPLESLNRFQDRYQMPLKRFMLYLEGPVDYKPLKCLPLTCFIFTHPFYNILKDSGARLQQNVEPDYQMQFVELLAYSFEGLEENVSEFIDIFTEGCIEFSGRNIQLLPLLEKLIIREQKQDKLFFDSLKNQITLFKHLFDQLREKRIIKLDDETIDFLLSMDEEQFCKQSRQPRVIGDFDEIEKRLKGYWEEFTEINPKSNFDYFSLAAVPPRLTQLTMLFGIKQLNPAQILSFFIMKEKFKSQRLFQQFTTGSGKTTFSLLWMLYAWLEFQIPSIANYTSMELCQNDYERLVNEAGSLNLSILLIANEDQLASWDDYNIVFTTTPLLQALLQDTQKLQNLKKRQLILDEFDASLFDSEQAAKDAQLFLQFQYLIAFTGSPLQLVHKNILIKHMDGLFMQYPSLDGLRGRNNVCHHVQVFPTRQPQFEKIVDICLGQSSQTPVLVILDKAAYKSFLQISTVRKLLIKNLAQSEPADVKAFFATCFTTPQNGHFFTALLSVGQGRGLDAPTNSEIEKAGGVYLIIGATPTTFRELDQFKGRTARMGGHGQYSIILWEKTSATAETFLKEHLTAQSSKELQNLSRQYINIIAPKFFNAYNEQGQEKNEDGPKAVVMEDNESENSGEVSKDFDEEDYRNDEEYQNTGKSTKINQEQQCKTCGKKVNKDHICKRFVASKQAKPTIYKTLGKRKRNLNETKTYKQPSMNKRLHKQAEQMKNNANIQQEKENNNPSDQDNSYVRVNEALKVVIPSIELQQFKDLNNCEDVLAKNQQQQQKELIKAQQSSSVQTKRQRALTNKQRNKPKSQREMVDEGYFAGYSESSIHKDMLNDLVRIEQYTKAINDTCKDKVVLDIGCGTGVLSVLAIKAGAIKVYAVDNADIEKLMSSEFKQHIKEGKIEFIKGTIEKLASDDHPKIPKVDVVLSEWMGYFLIFENMMSSYMVAIKTFLKSEGIVVPSHATMYLDAAFYDFVDNPKLAKKHFNPNNHCKVALIEQIEASFLLSSDPTSIKTFDFTDRDLQNPLDSEGFAGNFKIQVIKAGTFNAFVGSFDTKLCNEVFLNTMPTCPVTHWKQSLFFIANPIKVEPGDIIEGKIQIKTQEGNHRNLMVSLTYKVEGKESSKTEESFSFE